MSPRTEIPIREASDPPDDVDIWQRWTVGIGHGQPRRGADADFRYGSFSDLGARSCEVRFTSMSRHREFDHLRPKSAIKRRDGLHDFSRSLFVLSPRLVAAKKKG